MFVEIKVSFPQCEQKMMSFGGQDGRTKMTSPGGKLTALSCHLTKKVNKAEELTYPSIQLAYINAVL